jgi:hypothetical protein
MRKVKLGTQVTDKISGFTGVAIARTEFLNGCVRVGVQARVDKDGKVPEAEWFDEVQLGATPTKRQPSGPGPSPPSRDYPRR